MVFSVAFVSLSATGTENPHVDEPKQEHKLQQEQNQAWEQRWKKMHHESFSASKWALSYDLIEVISEPEKSPTPLLPSESIHNDPSAVISRLSVVQVVNKDKSSVHTVFADITLPYLLEVEATPHPESAPRSSQPNKATAYVYKLSDKGMVKISLPQNKSTSDIVEMASKPDGIWGLLHANPKLLDVVEWDPQGRPAVILEKNSPLTDKVYLYYNNNETVPYMIQNRSILENGKEKTSTIVVYKIDEKEQKQPWDVLDILKSATHQFLMP